jgi:hypothetical protein
MLIDQSIHAKQGLSALIGQQFVLTKHTKIFHLTHRQLDIGNMRLRLSEIQTISQINTEYTLLNHSTLIIFHKNLLSTAALSRSH